MSGTPTLDKLAQVATDRDAILHFLEWLADEHKAELATYHQHVAGCRKPHAHDKDCKKGHSILGPCPETESVCGMGEETLYPLRIRHEKLVMQYLGIDEKAVERERRALLASLG